MGLTSFGDWQLIGRLGIGGFGDVALWSNRSTNKKIATKRLKENTNFGVDEKAKLKQRWQQECKWMLSTDTPFIVRGIELNDTAFTAYLNENHVWRPLPVLVMEYCNGGDLRAQLQKVENFNGLHEYVVREVLYSLCRAIDYLHNKLKIEHRDLKPDNIVIHREGNQRYYKLTDFGFARTITHDTVVKSVVGTRNYFAPEVVDTAKYKNTVDYWSVGVIAFELMCGILPFIPHQDLFQIIKNIRNKGIKCIAITEDPKQPKVFIQHDRIFPQNRMTSVFVKKIENWLRSALDVNYKTRGTSIIQAYSGITEAATVTDEVQRASSLKSNRILTFYTEMEAILQTKILTIFCLNTYQFYCYEVTSELTLDEWLKELTKDLEIPSTEINWIFPAGHPRWSATPVKPIDFFVEQWQDTSNKNNPPVMLYISSYQCNYNAVEPNISDKMKMCLNRQAIDEDNEPIAEWVLRLFELETLHLLSQEQRHITAFLEGLKQYAITMEHMIFELDKGRKELQLFLKRILYLTGRVDQFSIQVHYVQQINGSELSNKFIQKWNEKSEKYSSSIRKIDIDVGQKVENRYTSALRRAEEVAKSSIYDDELKKSDTLLLEFQKHLNSGISDGKIRFELTERAVYDCLEARKAFLGNRNLCQARNTITDIHKEHKLIQEIIINGTNHLINMGKEFENDSVEFLKEYSPRRNISQQMSSLSLDCSANDAAEINGHEFNLESGLELLADAKQTINTIMEKQEMHVDDGVTCNNNIEK